MKTAVAGITLSLAISSWLWAGPVEVFVSPTGNDANAGTAERPLASLARARDQVRRLRRGPTSQPARVVLTDGVHHVAEPLALCAEDSNCDYVAADGARPVISGGREINGLEAADDGLWAVEVADVKAGVWAFNELFVNGTRRTRARHPNDGFLRVVKAGADNRTSFTFNPGELPEPPAQAGAELVFLHDWAISRIPLLSIDPKTGTLTTRFQIGPPSWAGQITGFEQHPRYFVENDRRWLDAPGEWYVDAAAGKLFYRPMPGEDLSAVRVVAPLARRLVVAAGDLKQKGGVIERLRFRGLTFQHCLFTPPAAGYAPSQAGYHQKRDATGKANGMAHLSAAVELASARQCQFIDCRFERLGGSGLRLGRGSVGNRIAGCTFQDIAGNGIMIGEDGQPVDDNVVEDCRIRRCGQRYFGCVGVWVGLTHGTIVQRSRISELPYSGVSVGWAWNTEPTRCGRNKVRDNDIHHVMLVLSDGGGIYTLGRQPGAEIAGNRIHDIPPNAGRAQSNGMFIDEGSSEFVIRDNVIWNVARTPVRFHKATRLTLKDNTLACGEGVPAFLFNSCKKEEITFQNNRTPPAAEFTAPTTAPED